VLLDKKLIFYLYEYIDFKHHIMLYIIWSLKTIIYIWACKGFDRGFETGEAIRMQCVKWQT